LLLLAAAPFAARAQAPDPQLVVRLSDGTKMTFTIAELERLPIDRRAWDRSS